MATGWVVVVVEADDHLPAGARLGRQDGGHSFGVDGHRLFGDHLAAGLQCADDVFVVIVIDRGHHHRIRRGLPQHLIEIAEHRHTTALAADVRGPRGVDVPHAHQAGAVAVTLDHRQGIVVAAQETGHGAQLEIR
jgi:hypothetical protein